MVDAIPNSKVYVIEINDLNSCSNNQNIENISAYYSEEAIKTESKVFQIIDIDPGKDVVLRE